MADNTVCTVCMRAAEQSVTPDKDEHTNAFYAELFDVSEASVRRHYNHGPVPRLPGLKEVINESQKPDSEQEEEGTNPHEEYSESSNGDRSVKVMETRKITLEDARKWIEDSGENPDDWNYSARSIAYGKGMFSNKMSAWPKHRRAAPEGEKFEEIDALALLEQLRKSVPTSLEPPEVQFGDLDSAFVVSLNDTQIGKGEGGGTPATIERVHKYVESAVARVKALRLSGYELDTLIILGGGDIVEGTCIFPNQSYTVDMARREQIRTAVALILHVIDRLAPLFGEVRVLATRGNHGENRIDGNKTTLHDNDDLLVFEMAESAVVRDENLAHVAFTIPETQAGVWTDVLGWRLATTHGDIYGKGVQGATQDKKAQAWYKNMAMARNPLGLADVLITHHFHHDKMSDWGSCLWRQTPAQDGGSMWFEQTTGEFSQPGMLTFVMTRESRYTEESVLR